MDKLNYEERIEESNKLLQTLHQQFSENQNHHSGLFIQILLALFSLFGVLGYVAINTKSFGLIEEAIYNDDIPYGATASLVSLVFLLLNKLVLNYGYSFRRDQMINQRIRFKYLKKDGYGEIFGEQYKADNKDLMDYLPAFFSVFFWAIFMAQAILCISMFILMIMSDCNNKCYSMLFFIIVLIALCTSFIFWRKGFSKYRSNIKSKN